MKPMQRSRRVWAFLGVLVLAAYAADVSAEPPRPIGLPPDAFWVGGPDGGVYLTLQRSSAPGSATYMGAVYYADGSIWYRGPLRLKPNGSKPIDPSDRKQFVGWDGTRVLLNDGRTLAVTGR